MSELFNNNEVLSAFEKVIPILSVLFDNNASIAITNREVFVKQINNEAIGTKPSEGLPVPEGGAVREALNTGKTMIKNVPKEIYGVPFKSYAIPVKGQDGTVDGVIVVGKSLAKQSEVTDISQHLSESVKQINAAINSLTTGISNLSDMNIDIANKMKQANELTEGTDVIIEFIKGVSSQTNLLGLNAAIEAARAGEMGKGFNIVAQEIRKLSLSTTDSIKKIDSVLKDIKTSIKSVTGNITNSNEIFQEQASAFQEISASIEELNATAQMMKTLAEKI